MSGGTKWSPTVSLVETTQQLVHTLFSSSREREFHYFTWNLHMETHVHIILISLHCNNVHVNSAYIMACGHTSLIMYTPVSVAGIRLAKASFRPNKRDIPISRQ